MPNEVRESEYLLLPVVLSGSVTRDLLIVACACRSTAALLWHKSAVGHMGAVLDAVRVAVRVLFWMPSRQVVQALQQAQQSTVWWHQLCAPQ